ncbi:MAG: hypothetical protein HN427_01190 [Flavobacteriales bacterium]|jgi:hypothetical protein|nr:hypothetical protein [Flavobacteriales bacterium]
MMNFLQSLIYFMILPFRKVSVDVVFYAPTHFNRGENNENLLFEPLLRACRNNNISFIVFEEPSSSSTILRNNKSIPFDFMYYLIIFFRKLFRKEKDIIVIENKIGRFLSKTFFCNFKYKNYIVLSKSMISVFSSINKGSKLFDLQHGIIHTNKSDYFSNNIISHHLTANKVSLLLSGIGFKNILLKNSDCDFIKNYANVIGVNKKKFLFHHSSNKNILVTLQFTEDHTQIQNNSLLEGLLAFIDKHKDFTFYLRNHPRFNNEVDLSVLFEKENTQISQSLLSDCFNQCSIHLTAYSTTTFECANFGIPTIFLNPLKGDFNMFETNFYYPLKNDLNYIEQHYLECSDLVRKWESEYYSTFDEQKFISLLK